MDWREVAVCDVLLPLGTTLPCAIGGAPVSQYYCHSHHHSIAKLELRCTVGPTRPRLITNQSQCDRQPFRARRRQSVENQGSTRGGITRPFACHLNCQLEWGYNSPITAEESDDSMSGVMVGRSCLTVPTERARSRSLPGPKASQWAWSKVLAICIVQ